MPMRWLAARRTALQWTKSRKLPASACTRRSTPCAGSGVTGRSISISSTCDWLGKTLTSRPSPLQPALRGRVWGAAVADFASDTVRFVGVVDQEFGPAEIQCVAAERIIGPRRDDGGQF